MTLGEKIRKVRKLNRMNQLELGELLGVKQRAVSHWESNDSQPAFEKLKKLSNTLRIPPSYWFDDEIEINKANPKKLIVDVIKALE